HGVAHAVVEGESWPEAADQRVKDAGLDHGGSQVDRPARLRIAGGEVEGGEAVADGDLHRQLDRLVDGDAVAVEQPFRIRLARRQLDDRGTQLLRGAVEDGGECVRNGRGAETGAKLLDTGRAPHAAHDLRLPLCA